MTRKIVALCLLILIPVTLNCMAGFDMTAAWGFAMTSANWHKAWIYGFGVAAAAVCSPFTPVASFACSAAALG